MPIFDGLDDDAQFSNSSEESSDSDFNVDLANDSKNELVSFIESLVYLSRDLSNDSNHNRDKSIKTVVEIFSRFHTFVRQLRNRYARRPSIDVNDEYDVQDLLHALLKIHFDDVRSEEYSPSYAGGNSRIDFILKKEKIAIEVKKTRKGLEDKKIGEELLIDIGRYRANPDCETLICCIYDPEGRIVNPRGLEDDIKKTSDSNVEVICIVNSK